MVFETIAQFMAKLMFFHGYVSEFSGFPDALSKAEEDELINKMLDGDKSARDALIRHNLRLVAHVSKKYSGSMEADELLSVGSIGLIKGIDSYRPNKGSQMSTYVSRCIENEILMLLRANKKHKQCVSIDEIIGVDKDGGEMTIRDIIPQEKNKDPDIIVHQKMTLDDVYSKMKTLLNKREYTIISLRYGLDGNDEHTQQEVADKLGISRSYISRIETKALSIIRDSLS